MTSPVFVNMTPHPINLLTGDGVPLLTIPPSGDTIRLDETEEMVDDLIVNGIQVEISFKTFSASADLPAIEANTFYIVSAMVANAYPERFDFLIVNRTVRDNDGRIMGCTAFARAAP